MPVDVALTPVAEDPLEKEHFLPHYHCRSPVGREVILFTTEGGENLAVEKIGCFNPQYLAVGTNNFTMGMVELRSRLLNRTSGPSSNWAKPPRYETVIDEEQKEKIAQECDLLYVEDNVPTKEDMSSLVNVLSHMAKDWWEEKKAWAKGLSMARKETDMSKEALEEVKRSYVPENLRSFGKLFEEAEKNCEKMVLVPIAPDKSTMSATLEHWLSTVDKETYEAAKQSLDKAHQHASDKDARMKSEEADRDGFKAEGSVIGPDESKKVSEALREYPEAEHIVVDQAAKFMAKSIDALPLTKKKDEQFALGTHTGVDKPSTRIVAVVHSEHFDAVVEELHQLGYTRM